MIQKLEVRNFKKFAKATFDFGDHVVIVGPNNCGKTSLMQALAVWKEVCETWMHSEDVREAGKSEGGYESLEITQLESMPYVDFGQMWRGSNTSEPIVISVKTRRWTVAFELQYIAKKELSARPCEHVGEGDLEACRQNPITLVYIPPFSGLETQESQVVPDAVAGRLLRDMVQGRGGSVLRTMLLDISDDEQKWEAVQKIVGDFFGYELLRPSGAVDIRASYRHSGTDSVLEISSGARGFLQVLFVCASLYYRRGSVLLVDEPDAHLHMRWQEKIYQRLRAFARQRGDQQGCQLIVTTHSEIVVNAAGEDLQFLDVNGLRHVPQDKAKHLVGTLGLETSDIVCAETERRVLYVEGRTDIDILREWARLLGHPLVDFLEKPFWSRTAERDKGFVAKHYSALRIAVPDLKAVELRDGNGRNPKAVDPPRSVKRLYWNWYEIENYLGHPGAVKRFVGERYGQEAGDKADHYMKGHYPPFLYDNFLGETSAGYQMVKGKLILAGIFESAGVECAENEYYHIAQHMTKDELHPEVLNKLDLMAEALGIWH